MSTYEHAPLWTDMCFPCFNLLPESAVSYTVFFRAFARRTRPMSWSTLVQMISGTSTMMTTCWRVTRILAVATHASVCVTMHGREQYRQRNQLHDKVFLQKLIVAQEISYFYRNTKFLMAFKKKRLPLTLLQTAESSPQSHTLLSDQFNIILPSTPTSTNWSLPFRYSNQTFRLTCTSHRPPHVPPT